MGFDVGCVNAVMLGSAPTRIQCVKCLVHRCKDSSSRPASEETVNGAVGTACLLEVPGMPCPTAVRSKRIQVQSPARNWVDRAARV